MTKRFRKFKLAGFGIGMGMAFVLAAQTPETEPSGTRGLQSQVFIGMRQEAGNAPKVDPPNPDPGKSDQAKVGRAKPRPSTGSGVQIKPSPQVVDSFVGLTFWRMVLASPSSQVKSRGFTHPKDDISGTKEWTAQRITLDQPVHENDNIRFTFESAPQGYLYVIDRDVFADGSFGEPVLIFPTGRIRGGRNDVVPGHPVQIPDPSDSHALQVEAPKPNQTGIQLIVISTPQQIPEIQVQADQQTIPVAWLTRWEKQWATNLEVTNDPKLNGTEITMAEQAAVTDPNHPLGPKDSLPVTLFHRRGPPGQPIYVTAMIRLEGQSPKKP